MGGAISKRRLETKALAEFLRETVPSYLDFGDKAVAFTWNPEALAECLKRYLSETETK